MKLSSFSINLSLSSVFACRSFLIECRVGERVKRSRDVDGPAAENTLPLPAWFLPSPLEVPSGAKRSLATPLRRFVSLASPGSVFRSPRRPAFRLFSSPGGDSSTPARTHKMAGFRMLDLVRPFLPLIPEVSAPDRKVSHRIARPA